MNSSFMDQFCGSTFWNISLTWYTTNPSFTRCFERSVLVWIPCLFFWIFSPVDIYLTRKINNGKISWTVLNVSKLIVNLGLVLTGVSNFMKALLNQNSHYVDIYSPLLQTTTFLYSTILLLFNKKKGIRSSGLQFQFWLLCCVCGAFQFKTEIESLQNPFYEASRESYTFLVYYPMTLLMLILNCFVDQESKYPTYKKPKIPNPESSTTFPGKLFYSWFDRLIWKGFRNPLVQGNLWDLLPENASSEIVPEFEREWNKHLSKAKRNEVTFSNGTSNVRVNLDNAKKSTTRVSVVPVVIKVHYLNFLGALGLEYLEQCVNFANPLILGLIIQHVSKEEEDWKGYLYAFLLFLIPSLQTLSGGKQFYSMAKIGLKIKSALVCMIYKKAMRLSNSARKEKTVGEIVNLMSVDAQKFMELTMHINMLFVAPMQIIIAIYLLWQELGISVLFGLLVMVLLVPLNLWIAQNMQKFHRKHMKVKDQRVKLMNEILNGIKVLKLYAWENSFEQYIAKFRAKEIKVLTLAAYLHAGMSFIWQCAPFLVSLASFASYVLIDENNILDAKKAYVSLALFNILRLPLSFVPMIISTWVQTAVSVKRLNDFLNSEELDSNNVTHEENSAALVIENGKFAWDETPVLKNINIRIEKRSLTAVVGPVGSGKSSLISAFLGEMEKLSGRVNTVGSIAYVPQQAWIQNATLKANILFGEEVDEKWYQQVIEACALKPDFDMLPGGDKTEIGEKGINLSGGQKQRVSLARAVYAKKQVYILDDPLSAVDSHVGKHIFEKVIGPKGLLRHNTRLLITHGITYLPETDQIIVLKDGQVSESGTYSELLQQNGDFAEFLLQHISKAQAENEDLDELANQLNEAQVGEEISKILKRQISEVSKSGSEKQNGINRQISKMSSTESLKNKKDTDIKGKKLIDEENLETGEVSWAVYKYYLNSIGILMCLAVIGCYIIFQIFSVGSNVWLSKWADDKSINVNGTVNTTKRDTYLGVYGALGIGQAAAIFFSNGIHAKATLTGARKIHDFLTRNVMRLPMSFFDTTPIGRILARFSNDINGVDMRLPSNFNMIFSFFIRVLATFFIITYTTPQFIYVIVPISIIYYFMQRVYVATSRQLKRLDSSSRAPIYSHFGESLNGAHTIRAFEQQAKFILESQKKVDENNTCFLPSFICNRWLSVRLEMLGYLITFFAALFAIIQKEKQPGEIGLSLTYAMQITGYLNWLVRTSSDVESNIVAVERIKEYGENPQEAPWEIESKKPPKEWPNAGVIEFQDFSVRYRPGLDLVLKHLNFTVKGGEKVGIVGRTGAGKSSLTLALFRIIESASGRILIDNIDISQIGLHSLRSKLTIIPQDAVLFSGSLRMNLDPFEEFGDEEIWRCLEHAHLKNFVQELNNGLQHEVTEGGENLSVGQRQLICLARALLRKTKILILDEATAAVDLETDDLIQKTIRTAFKDCTVLTIAHRLNTIMDSDRIAVLDKGEVVEFNSPKCLLADSNSIFYGMCKDAGINT